MSHYRCAVITDGTKTVEELMAAYQENNLETVPQEYLEFYDETDEYKSDYEGGSLVFYRDPDTLALYWQYDDRFKSDEVAGQRYVIPGGYAKVEIPCNVVYPTFESYMGEFCDKEPNEDGRYGYWENPNARWDWYTEYESPCWVDEMLGHTPTRLSGVRFDPDRMEAEARAFIRDNPADGDGRHSLERYLNMRGMTDEQYVESSRHLSFWACVTPDGEWHEVAKMGWFGMSEDVGGDAFYRWCVEFEERFIEPYAPDCVLHVLDCHI